MNFFRMMQNIEKTNLDLEAENTFNKLILCIEGCSDIIAPNSRIAKETLFNWRMGAEDQRKWYERRGIHKSSSTIRSQINYLSGLLVACFMPTDIMYRTFLSNDIPMLTEIENRIYVLTNSEFSLSDLSVDMSALLKDTEVETDLGDEKEVNKVLALIKKLDRKKTLKLFDECDKPTLICALQTLAAPLIQTKQYKYLDVDGIEKITTHTELNSEKMELLIKMRDVEEPQAAEMKERLVEKYIYKKEQLPYKGFMSMEEICNIIEEYCNSACASDVSGSGKTLERAGKFVDLFTKKENLIQFLNTFNKFDLSAQLEQYRIE